MAIPKITIIDGNNKIELSTIEDNIKAYMVKGEPGEDAISPTITTERDGKVTTLTIVDKDGTKETDINDGFDPVVDLSKENNVVTLSITDFAGTEEVIIKDGVDLTGGVPTNGVIGFDSNEIIYTCDGTETGDYYLTYEGIAYYFTMPTVADGDKLVFNTTDLTLKLDGTAITTSSTGTGTEITFSVDIPNGYEITNDGVATLTDLAAKQDVLVSGTNIKTINNTSLLGSGNINISGSTPVGSITMYAGDTAPSGYMICDGSAISRTDYADLYNIIGTIYGTGDGSTTFNLPNLKGKVPVGLNSSDTSFDTLGETGGEKTHTLTTNEMPSHHHQQKGFKKFSRSSLDADGVSWGNDDDPGGSYTRYEGGGQAHNNLQPYIVLNYIIKY